MSRYALCALMGLILGALAAWSYQGARLDSVRAQITQMTATAKASEQRAEQIEANYKREKEISDHEYETAIAALRADVVRLRNSRARTVYVPAAPDASRRPDLACFDRAELESALRRFDDGVSGLTQEGDENAVRLNAARAWSLHTLP